MIPLNPGAYEFYLQAKGYLKRNDLPGNIDSAIQVAHAALRQDSNFTFAHTALAEAYWQKYQKEKNKQWLDHALTECRKALDIEPGSAQARTMMGTVYAGTGHHDQALEEFRKALAIDPRSFDAHLGLGRVYILLNDYAKAEAPFRKAIELQRQDWHGYRELGLLYFYKSDYRKAIEQYEHVVDLTPDNATAYSNLGAFYGLLKESRKSEEMLKKALQIEPKSVGALTNMAKLLSDQDRNAEAAVHLERAAALDPKSYRILGNLGSEYKKLKRAVDARRSYESGLALLNDAIAVDPEDGKLFSNRAHFLAALGRKKEALADLARTGSLQSSEREMVVRDAISFAELVNPTGLASF